MCAVCDEIRELTDEGRELSAEEKEEQEKAREQVCPRCGKHEPLVMALINPADPAHEAHAKGLPPFRMTACMDCGLFVKLPDQEPLAFGEENLDAVSNPPGLAYHAGRLTERAGRAIKKRREKEIMDVLSKGFAGALEEFAKRDEERKKAREAAQGQPPSAPPAE